MKYFILFILLISVNSVIGQITVDGQFHKFQNYLYNFSDTGNRVHLKIYTIFTCPDSTSKDSVYIVNNALGKIIRTNTHGWNHGKFPLCTNSDTAVFNVIYYIAGPDKKDSLESAVQFVMNNMPTRVFDTANRTHNILTSIGAGAVTQLAYLMNTFSSEKFYKNFSVFYPVDFASNSVVNSGANWLAIKQPMQSWWFSGSSGGFPYNVGFTTDAYDSALVHNSTLNNTKLTLLTGQNYSTLTHDSAYYGQGTDAANNPYLWFTNASQCIDLTASKIIVDSFMVLDGGGFWAHASYSTYYYFDSQGNPLQGDLTPDNTTGNTSIGGGIYYQDAPSNGIAYDNHITIVDFTRDTSTVMYNVTEAWTFVSNLSNTPDTIQVVLGDSTMSANYISHLRNNTVATFNIITTGGCNCWQRVWQGSVHSQHALVSFRRHSNGDETAVTGIVFYGHPLAGQGINTYQYDSTYALSSDTFHQDVRQLTGGNFYNNYDTAYMTPMHHRDGINTIFKANNDSTVIQPQQDPSSRNYTDSLIKLNYPLVHQYYSIQGPVTKVFNQTSDFLQRPVDSVGADWRLPESFFTIGKLSYGEAFAFGNNPSANNAYFKSSGGWIKANNTLYGVEWGNEPNGVTFTNYWQDPISIGAMITMVLDGCNGKYVGYGAHQADTNFKVYVPATAGIDVRWQAFVMRYLQYYYHTAHPKVIFGFHAYPQAHKKGIGLTTNESIGNYVVNPSNQGYLQDKVFAVHMMNGYWHGLCPLTVSEEGADKQYARTVTSNGQFDSSLAGIVQYGSFTPERSLAIYQVTCLMNNAFLPITEANIYSYPDFDAPNAQNIYHTFSGSGWRYFYYHPITFVLDSIHTSEGWYYYQGIANSLWGYNCVQVIDSNSNGLFIYKFRNIANPTHVKYVLWNDNPNNSTLSPSLTLGATIGTVLKQQGQFNSFSLTSTTVVPSGGVLSVSVGSQHVIIDATELVTNFRGFPYNGRPIFFGH